MNEIVGSELILGGQRSGKSRRAESLAGAWLATDATRRALLLATAQPWDDEMRDRIARHRSDRAQRVPGMRTVEEPVHLAAAVQQHSTPDTLIVIDCLTLWLMNLCMPSPGTDALNEADLARAGDALAQAIAAAAGPVVLVSNEIGLGVIPMGEDVRAFVDAQGRMNQCLAQACQRVTLMTAGLPLCLKGIS